MRVRISGPLKSHSVGIVFDSLASATGAPGFYPIGEGYTVLTVTGAVIDFAVGIYGPTDGPAREGGDRRARIDGIQFGAADSSVELSLSHIRHVRVYNLAGFGVRYAACWDTTFVNTSVEVCGTADQPAFDVVAALPQTCNESVWVRVHVELSVGRAMRVSSLTLSCVFLKIHSERATAVKGRFTWELGGACEYGSVRLHAVNPAEATAHFIGDQGSCRNLRSEGPAVSVDATGGTYRFDNPGALVMRSSLNQNGQIVVTGGSIGRLEAASNWLLIGTRIDTLQADFMPEQFHTVAQHCTIGLIEPKPGQTTAALDLYGCDVGALRLHAGQDRIRRVTLHDGTRARAAGALVIPPGSVLEIAVGAVAVGEIRLAGGALRLRGTIKGDLHIDGPCHAIAGGDAQVTGQVSSWSVPVAASLLGELPNGTRSKNLAPTAILTGWIKAGGAWIDQRN
ncbi:hypothetical protein GCM10022268_33570 [Sphingomonas cynarae]|uniref:Uncharacterized protein n=2 Tax=Sphingomonas cynarae TaxID=930197 RepID=A0ABP7ES51_9SPHN